MISTPLQYETTKAQAWKFQTELAALKKRGKPAGMSEVMWKAQIDGIESVLADLASELIAYEASLWRGP